MTEFAKIGSTQIGLLVLGTVLMIVVPLASVRYNVVQALFVWDIF